MRAESRVRAVRGRLFMIGVAEIDFERFWKLHIGSGGEVVVDLRMIPRAVQKNDDAGSQ